MRLMLTISAFLLLVACGDRVARLQSPESSVRTDAALSFHGTRSWDDVRRVRQLFAARADDEVRADMADALGYARDREAVPLLIDALVTDHWMVRRSVVRALGRIGGTEAEAALVRIVREWEGDLKKEESHRMAVGSFAGLRCWDAVPVLLDLLKRKPGSDESERIDYVHSILRALGHQGDNRAIPAIAAMLDGYFAVGATRALGQIVGEDFMSDGMRVMTWDPAKAKAWLKAHPEALDPRCTACGKAP